MKKLFKDHDPALAASFVQQFERGPKGESPCLYAYKCPAQIYTIGWGHTKGVKAGDRITKERAVQLLEQDLKAHAAELAPHIKTPVSQNQFIALLDFCFNFGVSKTASSTLVKFINQGDFTLAATQFKRWVNCNGKPLEGLVTRRKAEEELFLKEDE